MNGTLAGSCVWVWEEGHVWQRAAIWHTDSWQCLLPDRNVSLCLTRDLNNGDFYTWATSEQAKLAQFTFPIQSDYPDVYHLEGTEVLDIPDLLKV